MQDAYDPTRDTATYRRPDGPYARLISKFLLGPPPADFDAISTWELEETDAIPHKRMAYALAIFVWATWIIASTLVPVLRFGPLSFLFGSESGASSPWVLFGLGSVMAVMSYLALSGRSKYPRHWVCMRRALSKEQWMRAGAEKWSHGTRVRSCLAFACCDFFSLLFPLVAIPVLTVVGAVLMRTYMRVYWQTHDRRAATLAAAKLHQLYEASSEVAIGVVLGIYAASCAAQLLIILFG